MSLTIRACVIPFLAVAAGAQIRPGDGWFLQGKVRLEDGAIPTAKVAIESVCNGIPRVETTLDKKGDFHFTLGRNNPEVMQDAARSGTNARGAQVPTGWDGNNIQTCSVRAVLDGYKSDEPSLTDYRAGEKPELGIIVLHKLGAADAQIPKDAKKAFDKGAEAAKSKQTAEAVKNFRKAVEIHPGYAQAWYGLGAAQVEARQPVDARESFHAAIKADAKYVQPYLALATLEAGAQNWKSLADVTGRLLHLPGAGTPQVHLFHAVACLNLQDFDAAEKSAREGQAVDPQHQVPKLYQVMGAVLAARGQPGPAAEQLRKYLEYAPQAPDAARVKADLAEMEKAQPRQ